MLDKSSIDNALRLNGLSADSPEADIRAFFSKMNWSEQMIEDSLRLLKGGAYSPSPQSGATGSPSFPTAGSPSTLSGISVMPKMENTTPFKAREPILPLSSSPTPPQDQTPLQNFQNQSPAPESPPTPKNSRSILMWVGILFLCFIFIGIGAAAGVIVYFPQYNPFSAPPFKETELFSGLLGANRDISTAKYALRMNIYTEPRSANAAPFPRKSVEKIYGERAGGYLSPSLLRLIPKDFDVTLGLSGILQRGEEDGGETKLPDTEFRFDGSVDSPDFTANVDIELLKKDRDFYVRINRFPAFFGNISSVRDKWIRYTVKEGDNDRYSKSFKSVNDRVDLIWEQLGTLARVAEDFEVVSVSGENFSNDEKGAALYRYNLSLHGESLASFYEEAAKKTKEEFEDKGIISFNEKTYQLLRDEDYYSYLEKNMSIEVVVEKRTGLVREVRYSFLFVPDDEITKLEGQQVRVEVSIALDDVNEEVYIERPSDSITSDEASILISGYSAKDSRRIADIKQIQLGLELYFDAHKVYPKTLDQLVSGSYIAIVPKDPETGNPFYYYPHTPSLGGCRSYHLAATLSYEKTAALGGDADILTNPGVACGASTFQSGKDPVYDVTP